jgi:hypothetical protein
VSLLSAFAQNGLRPEIRVQPISGVAAPQVPMSLLPFQSGETSPYESDFFPAAPRVLFDNTALTGYYFPVSNRVFDDANIPNSLDTDGDNEYFLTLWQIAFFVPATAQQPVLASFYLAPPTPTGGVDFDAMLTIDANLGHLPAGYYVVSIAFPRCSPYRMPTLQITGTNGNLYDLFWVGLKFPQYCTPHMDSDQVGCWRMVQTTRGTSSTGMVIRTAAAASEQAIIGLVAIRAVRSTSW